MNEKLLTEENQESKPGGEYRESRSQEFGFYARVSEESESFLAGDHNMRPKLLTESGKWWG